MISKAQGHHPLPSASAPGVASASSARDLSPDRPASCGPALPPGSEPLFQTLPDSQDSSLPSEPSVPLVAPSPQVQPVSSAQDVPVSLEVTIAKAIQQGLAQGFQQYLLLLTSQLAQPHPASLVIAIWFLRLMITHLTRLQTALFLRKRSLGTLIFQMMRV